MITKGETIYDLRLRICRTLMQCLVFKPDPWQEVLFATPRNRVLLNCTRQAGKSTAAAVLGLATATIQRNALVLILSRSLRQATELFRRIESLIRAGGERYGFTSAISMHEVTFKNGSRIVCLPCMPDTVRGFSRVDLLIVDEAALVPDNLYRVVRPMLAVSQGTLLALSTPAGKRGWFHEAWHSDNEPWLRIRVPASEIPRISAEFLAQERKVMGESWFRQEYECSFEMMAGAVYPQWPLVLSPGLADRALAVGQAMAFCPRWGGMDFGFRNPFAAIWGYLEPADRLCIIGERYGSGLTVEEHARHLPKSVMWFCDPSGAGEIRRLRLMDFKALGAENALREGIAAVSGRIQSGRLLIDPDTCPNLAAEGSLYAYDPDEQLSTETPIDRDNHALSALRYLVMGLSKRCPKPKSAPVTARLRSADNMLHDEQLWTSL